MTNRHVSWAWVVTCDGKPDWDIRRAYSIDECWQLAMQKFNTRTKAQLRKHGIGIAPIRVVEILLPTPSSLPTALRKKGHARSS